MRSQPPRPQRKPSTSGIRPSLDRPFHQRTLIYVTLVAFALIIILFSTSPNRREIVTDLRVFHHTPTHKPPPQSNSTRGDVHWFSDWKWLDPFSASITFDDDRSVLPPLKSRPPIYTFYDADTEKDEKIKAAANGLLLIWRRAWWAHGFRPVVLGRSEAMNNPLYEPFHSKKLPGQLEADFVRWLAWGHMGSGILANWLCLPMGAREEHFLSFLRRGEYPKLTRYEGLDSGLFTGEKEAINAAIKEALAAPKLGDTKALTNVITMSADEKPSSIAFYDDNTITEIYKPISRKLSEDRAQGLASLGELILSHLHLSFLSRFSDGIEVITPFPRRSNLITHTAHRLATALRNCPASPITSSCPPNQPECKPCSPSTAPPILTPEFYTNSSSTYTIGTLPHPYTFASLLSKTRDITTRHIRRDTGRDRWLGVVTQKILGKERDGPSRLVNFKDNVAGDLGAARSFWIIDEVIASRKDIEYHFGFTLPTFNVTGETLPPLPDGPVDHEESKREKKAKEKDIQLQKDLIEAAKEVVRHKRKKKEKTGVKEMVEAWNLADTEAWRFVRAFRAREKLLREKWEQEERRFAGGDEGEGGWRWFDKRRGDS